MNQSTADLETPRQNGVPPLILIRSREKVS
jgi:hypothetical protein